MDDLRFYHPSNKRIFAADPFGYDGITGRAAGKWNAWLLDLARQEVFGTVYQTTLAKRFFAEKIVREFSAAAYTISLHCLAVPSKESLLGIFNRFERAFASDRTPRWVDIPYHDMAYDQFPVNAQYFEENLSLERVAAYRRNGHLVYLNTRVNGAWDQNPGIQAAIERDRSRPWTKAQKEAHVFRWQDIVARYERRFPNAAAYAPRILEAQGLLREAELFAQARRAAANDNNVAQHPVHATTHHHVFVMAGNRMFAFDRPRSPEPNPPSNTLPQIVSVAGINL